MTATRMKIQNSPTIRRMPAYLHRLLEMQQEGRESVSSTELAEYMHIEPIVVRKDIALTGISGQRRVGYHVDELIRFIKNYLGWQNPVRAALIGAGALGTALLGYDDFAHYGLILDSVFDCDAKKIGTRIRGKEIFSMESMEERLKKSPVSLAIICVSSAAAQSVVDRLVNVGVRCIWNFANVSLRTPPGVIVQREVIAGGLAMLSVKMKNSRLHPGAEILE